jgi:hypothetical protein
VFAGLLAQLRGCVGWAARHPFSFPVTGADGCKSRLQK